jgi:hypothetical protein
MKTELPAEPDYMLVDLCGFGIIDHKYHIFIGFLIFLGFY